MTRCWLSCALAAMALGVAGAAQQAAEAPPASIGGETSPELDVADALQRLARLEARSVELVEQRAALERVIGAHAHQGPDGGAADRPSEGWLVVTDVDRRRAHSARDGVGLAQARDAELRAELARLEGELAAARQAGALRAIDGERTIAGRPVGTGEPEPAIAEPDPTEAIAVTPPSSAVQRIAPVSDHRRIGTALVAAGIELLRQADRLQAEHRSEAAGALRERARARLEEARAALAPVAAAESMAPLPALFALARCEEKLGRIPVADSYYRLIAERDPRGAFGSAARTARTVLRWLDDTGDWRPRRDVDRIDWDAR